jgi:hypothetical protein
LLTPKKYVTIPEVNWEIHMARRRLTGRLETGRKVLMDASDKALLTGERVIRLRCRDKDYATTVRQACYSYQRSWIIQIEDQAIADGKDPDLIVNKALLAASWPSASIKYENRDGEHWLLFVFKRIPTDPTWDEIIQADMVAGPFPEKQPRLKKEEVLEIVEKKDD